MIRGIEKLEEFLRSRDIRNFKVDEFVCPHCGEVLIDPNLVVLLQEFRDRIGRPVVITSAYRCEEYNKAIGGVPNSAHIRGYAVDVAIPDSGFRYALIEFLTKSGITRFGIAEDFVHFDLDPDKPQGVVWVYGSRRHLA